MCALTVCRVSVLCCAVICCVVWQAVPGEDGEGAIPDRDQRPTGPAVRDAWWARLGEEGSCWWREGHYYGGKAQYSFTQWINGNNFLLTPVKLIEHVADAMDLLSPFAIGLVIKHTDGLWSVLFCKRLYRRSCLQKHYVVYLEFYFVIFQVIYILSCFPKLS